MATIDRTGEHISMTERRAMEAERDTIDRYVAAFLAQHVGEVMEARITRVTNFGFFATVAGIGGAGLVPVSTLGAERVHFDEASRTLGCAGWEEHTSEIQSLMGIPSSFLCL